MSQTSSDLPLVSIIVPVYNGARYLHDSLNSILGQAYPHIEVLVMDDASTDATPALIASFGDRIRVCRQPRNRGIYGNANDGIALASGKFIAVYHADDLYGPHIVEREVDFLERYPHAGAVFCADIMIDPEGRDTSYTLMNLGNEAWKRNAFSEAEQYYLRTAAKAGRIVYVTGMLLGSTLIVAVCALAALLITREAHSWGREAEVLLLCSGAGAVGALVSVLSRMSGTRDKFSRALANFGCNEMGREKGRCATFVASRRARSIRWTTRPRKNSSPTRSR